MILKMVLVDRVRVEIFVTLHTGEKWYNYTQSDTRFQVCLLHEPLATECAQEGLLHFNALVPLEYILYLYSMFPRNVNIMKI